MSVLDLMTPEQRELAKQPMAMTECKVARFPMDSHPQRLTGHFHSVCGLQIREAPEIPTVEERLLRGKLLLEEVLETFAAMGLGLTYKSVEGKYVHHNAGDYLTLDHIEGSRYDVVETADGLSDINVIVAGTAVAFGIPLHVTDYEVYSSNLTKLDESGKPIINQCKYWIEETGEPILAGETRPYCRDQMNGESVCQTSSHWTDPAKPVGKLLKPANYVPANIAAALLAFENREF